MKYFLSTKYKLGRIELDEEGTLTNGGEIFKSFVGYHISKVKEHFKDKKYPVKLTLIKEEKDADESVTERGVETEDRLEETSRTV